MLIAPQRIISLCRKMMKEVLGPDVPKHPIPEPENEDNNSLKDPVCSPMKPQVLAGLITLIPKIFKVKLAKGALLNQSIH